MKIDDSRVLFVSDRVLLSSSGCPQTQVLVDSALQVLGLQVCTATRSFIIYLIFIFLNVCFYLRVTVVCVSARTRAHACAHARVSACVCSHACLPQEARRGRQIPLS